MTWIRKRQRVSSSQVAARLGISRQAAHKRLEALAARGLVMPVSSGRTAAWEPASEERHRFTTRGLAEDRVWRDLSESSAILGTLSPAARRITAYAFTEMLNNAIEHSGAKTVVVSLRRSGPRVEVEVVDAGKGAFATVRAGRKLASHEEALAELTKGKVTTAPEAHSGEGIFFTSRAVNHFVLEANGLALVVDGTRRDWTMAQSDRKRGTRVRFSIDRKTDRVLEDVFREFAIDESFSKSRIVVKLFAHGVEFVSRSEARRILAGLEQFREVVLDFHGVASIGQAFADEVFRVWALRHPETKLTIEAAARPVAFMIERARPQTAANLR